MKKYLSMFLIYGILMLSMAGIGVSAVGTESDGYALVTSEAEFKEAVQSNGKIRLANDIILGTSDEKADWASPTTMFTGELDGNNKTITVYTSTTTDNTGIFSIIGGDVKIYDLTIRGTVKTTANRVGALAGSLNSTTSNSKISNITNYAAVTADLTYAGGIIGAMESLSSYMGTIQNLYNYGNVSAARYVGGIVGSNKSNLSLCANFGTVTSSQDWYVAGGIAGHVTSDCTIEKSYNAGAISGYYAAGIAGHNVSASKLLISDCYNTGTITSNGTALSGGIFARIQSSYKTEIKNCYHVGVAAHPISAASDGLTITNSFYLSETLTDDNKDGTTPLSLEKMLSLDAKQLGSSFIQPAETTYQFPEILGNLNTSGFTIDDGYTDILSVEDWNKIKEDATGKYELKQDLTLGNESVPYEPFDFQGTLKGNGHTITLTVNKTSGSASPAGLFAAISGAVVIENLIIDGSVYGSAGYAGGITGVIGDTSSGSKLSNITNNATISASISDANPSMYIGGIFGAETTWNNKITLSNLINNGSVTGYNYVGGIGGMNKSAIAHSANHGVITGQGGVGGITGRTYGSVEKSYNSGDIQGVNTGGISGRTETNLSISDCYNTGDMNGTGKAAGILSDANAGIITIKNCYNLGSVSRAFENRSYIYMEGNATESVSNCYYLDVNSTDDKKEGTTPKTLEEFKATDMATKLGASYVVPTGHYEFPEISDNLNSTSFTLYKTVSSAEGEGTITPSGIQYMKGGTTAVYTLKATAGYQIKDLLYNDVSIPGYANKTDAVYESQTIDNDITVQVIYEKIPDVLEEDIVISKDIKGCVPDIVSDENIRNQDGEFTLKAGEKYGVFFASVTEFQGWELIDWGVELNGKKYSSLLERTESGNFGILFYGDALKSGVTLEAKPYATYKNITSDKQITVYGTKSLSLTIE